jgi:hypothetical protein
MLPEGTVVVIEGGKFCVEPVLSSTDPPRRCEAHSGHPSDAAARGVSVWYGGGAAECDCLLGLRRAHHGGHVQRRRLRGRQWLADDMTSLTVPGCSGLRRDSCCRRQAATGFGPIGVLCVGVNNTVKTSCVACVCTHGRTPTSSICDWRCELDRPPPLCCADGVNESVNSIFHFRFCVSSEPACRTYVHCVPSQTRAPRSRQLPGAFDAASGGVNGSVNGRF